MAQNAQGKRRCYFELALFRGLPSCVRLDLAPLHVGFPAPALLDLVILPAHKNILILKKFCAVKDRIRHIYFVGEHPVNHVLPKSPSAYVCPQLPAASWRKQVGIGIGIIPEKTVRCRKRHRF